MGDARRAWYRMLQLSRATLRELDRRLDDEHRISVSEFDVLITLANAAGQRLRMTDLAEAVMFSSGGLTRLIGRLEGRGLVLREPDPADARGSRAALTAAGARRLAAARLTHDAVIDEIIGAPLTTARATTFARTLDQLASARSRAA
jgi:DNA-binding MarR family transcriptional regulator